MTVIPSHADISKSYINSKQNKMSGGKTATVEF